MLPKKTTLENRLLAAGVDGERSRETAQTTFGMPETPERITQLALKYAEYIERETKGGFRNHVLSTKSKRFLLGAALQNPETTLAEAWDAFESLPVTSTDEMYIAPDLRLSIWMDAANVVLDYIKTGGENVGGGSLPNAS
jgi:hypothetical protein